MRERSLTPVTTKDKEAARETLERNGIIWSQVEATIKRTYSDIFLIFDCCNAGRLGQQMRGEVSTYEFLGACPANKQTRGPGRQSFTHALTSVLEDFAGRKPFTTEDLRKAIMAHDDFPEDQEPVLSFRRLGREHIVIASKSLAQQETAPTLSKAERVKELKNKQYIDFRFWYGDEVRLDHLYSTADVLKPLTNSTNSHWDRIEFIEKSSILHRTAMRWKDLALSRRKRHQSTSAPVPGMLSGDVAALEVANTPTLQIPTGPFASPVSEAVSASLLGAHDCEPVTPPRTYAARHHLGNEPIAYHIKAIARKLRLMTWIVLRRLLDRVSCADHAYFAARILIHHRCFSVQREIA
jgi:hypothetical protein